METYHCLMLEIEGKNKMSIWDDIKKAAKGSEEYQAGKAKRKAKRAKSPLGKAVKQVKKDVKSAVKGSKEYQAGKAKKKAAKAKKKEGKTWTKAVKAQKKAGGSSMNELIKARNAAKASGDKAAYAAAQNKINKAYGSKKVHKAAPKKVTPSGPEGPGDNPEYAPKPGQQSTMQRNRPKAKEGGLVENNAFGWPSADARKR